MNLLRTPLFIGISVTLSMSGVLYMTKYQVRDVEIALAKVNREIFKKEESIHILRTERSRSERAATGNQSGL